MIKEQEGIQDIFSWIGTKIKALFAEAEPVLVTNFKAFVTAFEGVAISAVAEEAPKVIDGTEKFSNAVSTVTNSVETSGWNAAGALVETLVQDAYTAWKLKNAQPGANLLTPPASK